MLGVMLTILKIIGILLLVILGVIVLAVLLILFLPIRYQGAGAFQREPFLLNGEMEFSYLFRLIRGRIGYQDGKFTWRFSLFGARFSNDVSEPAPEETIKKDSPRRDVPPSRSSGPATKSTISSPSVKEDPEAENMPSHEEIRPEEKKKEEKERKTGEKTESKPSFTEKMGYTFQRICDRIKLLLKDKDLVMDFIQDPVHRSGARKAVSALKRFCLKAKPDHWKFFFHFGFDDPSTTGTLLGGICALAPVMAQQMELIPEFDEEVLEGNIDLKGKLRVSYLGALIWQLLWDKQVRSTWQDIRSFHLYHS